MLCHWHFWSKIWKRKNKKDSLQAVNNSNIKTFPPTDVKPIALGRVSPCTFRKKGLGSKGALTVEAALILPLFFLGMTALICLMDISRIQADVMVSLNESAKELGMYAYAVRNHQDQSPVGAVSDAVCIAYASAKLNKEEGVKVDLVRSRYRDQTIELVADISYQLPVSPFPLPKVRFQSRVQVHDWTGYSKDGDGSQTDEEMVYITDRQTVYHTHADCTHLNLTIVETTKNKAEKLRNDSGAKYYACPHCARGGGTNEQCYITKRGDRYHFSRSCSSLTRNVRLVPKSEAGGKSECSRCAVRGG